MDDEAHLRAGACKEIEPLIKQQGAVQGSLHEYPSLLCVPPAPRIPTASPAVACALWAGGIVVFGKRKEARRQVRGRVEHDVIQAGDDNGGVRLLALRFYSR